MADPFETTLNPEIQATYHTPPDIAEQLEHERERELQAKNQHFLERYTNPEKLDEDFQSKEGVFALSHTLKPKEVKQQSLNWAFLNERYGRRLSFTEYPKARREYGLEQYGLPDASDAELFEKIKGDYEVEVKRKDAFNQLHTQAITLGLLNARAGEKQEGFAEQFGGWLETNREILKGKDQAQIIEEAYRYHQKARGLVDGYGDAAAKFWETYEAYSKGEAGEIEYRQLAESLALIPKHIRDTQVYPMMVTAVRTLDGDLSKFQQFGANFAKHVAGSFSFLGPLYSSITGKKLTPGNFGETELTRVPFGMGVITLPRLAPLSIVESGAETAFARAERMPPGPQKDAALAQAHQVMEMTKVVRELHNVSFDQADPVQQILPGKLGVLERGIYGIGSSVGFMAATAANPYLGFAAIARQEYNQWRTEFPEMSVGVAQMGSLVSAIPQSIIEKFQVEALTVKLPLVSGFLRGMKPSLFRGTLKAGASILTQNVQEHFQDAISEFTPGLIFALTQDVPGFDWNKHFKEYVDSRGEVIVASTIFGLIGAGAVDLGDFKNPRETLHDRNMTYAGFGPLARDRIHRAIQSGDSARVQQVVAQELPKRKAKNIEFGKEVEARDHEAVLQAQENPNAPTFEVSEPDANGDRTYTVTRRQSGELTPEGEKRVNDYQSIIDCLGRSS